MEHLGKDAARWLEFGSSVADLAGAGDALIYPISEEVDLIEDFLSAYNTLCATFIARAKCGESGMTALGTTLTSVVNSFKNLDTTS
jgi:hypothetical protein